VAISFGEHVVERVGVRRDRFQVRQELDTPFPPFVDQVLFADVIVDGFDPVLLGDDRVVECRHGEDISGAIVPEEVGLDEIHTLRFAEISEFRDDEEFKDGHKRDEPDQEKKMMFFMGYLAGFHDQALSVSSSMLILNRSSKFRNSR